MAKIETLVDDLDGKTSEGVERVYFTWAGHAMEIDLTPANRTKFEAAIAPWFEAARAETTTTTTKGTKPATTKPKAAKTKSEGSSEYVSPTAGWDSEELDLFKGWRKSVGKLNRGRVQPELVAEFLEGRETYRAALAEADALQPIE